MNEHEWGQSVAGHPAIRWRATVRGVEWWSPHDKRWIALEMRSIVEAVAPEILRLAARERELEKEGAEAMEHALGMSNEITALHEDERRRRIELLAGLIDVGTDDWKWQGDSSPRSRADMIYRCLTAKLAELRTEEG